MKKVALYLILFMTTICCLSCCSTEEPQHDGNGSLNGGEGSRGESSEEEIVLPEMDGLYESGKSDHLFKYENPNIDVPSEGITVSLSYEPVKRIAFYYLVCRDVSVEKEGTGVEYMHDWAWYIDEIAGPHYPHFIYHTDMDFFSSGDVAGLNGNSYLSESETHDVKKIAEANNVQCVDWILYKSMEIKAGEDNWVTALIDITTNTVTFTVKPNYTGKPRDFTFAMGGTFRFPPFEYLDNGVIVHQAAR